MKNKFAIAGFALLFAISVSTISFIPPQNGKAKKDQQDRGNQGKGNQGNKGNQDKGNKANKGNQENQGNKGNQGRDNDDNTIPDDNANNGRGKKVRIGDDGNIIWDRETFKDRKDLRKNEKVTICHKFDREGSGVTISVSSNALKAHLGHGDVQGSCPNVSNRNFSDIFIKRRDDYYTTILNGHDQVLYSESVLDYALRRLAESRLQLDQYRASGLPAEEIRRREATVLELEQNTSLLETLLTAAAALVVDRL